MQTITEQLDAAYAAGKIAVICTHRKTFPIYDRAAIRAAKDGKGVYFGQGKSQTYAFAYQVKFAKLEG